MCNIGKTTGVRVRSVLRLYAWPLELKRIRKRHRDSRGLDRISRRDRDLKRVLPPRNIGNAQSYTIEIRRDLWGGGSNMKNEIRVYEIQRGIPGDIPGSVCVCVCVCVYVCVCE